MTLPLPYDLAAPQLYAGAQLSGGPDEYAIQLTTAPWAYGCVFPPSPAQADACTIEFELLVHEGQAQLASLGPMGRYCFDEAISSGRGPQRLSLRVAAHEHRGALVVRSVAAGVCRLRLRPVAVTERKPEEDEAAELARLEELMVSASRLGDVSSGTEVQARAAGAARQALGSVMARMGMAVIPLGDPGYTRWLEALSDRQLVELASAMVLEPTSPRMPGWRLDWALQQADPYWQLRFAVWRAMRDRCPTAEIDLRWLGGTVARMPLGSDLSLPLFTLGQFEPNICRLVRPMLREGGVFVDIGANEGLYTLLAAAAVGEQGLVVAVEPSPRELRRLRRNIARNGFGGRVVVLEQAMSADAGWADFAIASEEHAGLNAFADRFDGRAGLAATRPTAMTTFDMLADRLAPRAPDFVKIDVEGAEFDILCGADRVIEDIRPAWVIEIGRTDTKGDMRVVERLRRADYALFAVDDVSGDAVRPQTDEAWEAVDNMIAVPEEQLAERWPSDQV